MKIIRDFLKDRIPEEDWRHTTDEVEIRALLKEKLEEELEELAEKEYLSKEEYADMIDVLYALMHWHNIDRHEVNDIRIAKAAKNGAFYDGLIYDPVNKDRGKKEVSTTTVITNEPCPVCGSDPCQCVSLGGETAGGTDDG